jgi:hypothetical protein
VPIASVNEPPSASTDPSNPWSDVLIDTSDSLISGESPSRTLLLRRRKEKRLRWLWASVIASVGLLALAIGLALRHH